jgi:hypothetical protein
MTAIGEDTVGDGDQQQRREFGGRRPTDQRRQQGSLGAVTMAHTCPMSQPAAEQRQRTGAANRQRLTLAPRRSAVTVARHPTETVKEG